VLIVNADDFGASANVTSAICEAFDAGAITSTSGMVWMTDSARAAGIATERHLPTGLHLNLTLPFTAADTPRSVRERQLQLTGLFTSEGWREDAQRRLDRELLRSAISDQLERFREQFGEPTHIDGHHHVHVADRVFELLPQTWPTRPPLRVPARADARPSRVELSLRAHLRAPDLSLAFEHLHPALGGSGLDVLHRARDASVEVMTHPASQPQLAALLADDWRRTLAALPLGCYGDLAHPGPVALPTSTRRQAEASGARVR